MNFIYKTPITLKEFIEIEKTVQDINKLLAHQNLVLLKMLKENSPILAQLIRNFIVHNLASIDSINMILNIINEQMIEIMKKLEYGRLN